MPALEGDHQVPMEVQLHKRGITLTRLEEERIQRHTKSLEKRIEKFPDPRLELAIEDQAPHRGVRVDLRLALGPLGGHLISHQEGQGADVAVKAAINDVKRQLERVFRTSEANRATACRA